MTDRETGKPRGFGFVEFYDIPTAESAIRNLGGSELNGRVIRIVFAEGGPIESFRPRREDAANSGPPDGSFRPRRGGTRNKIIGADLAYHSSQGMAALLGQKYQPGDPADALTQLLARKTRSELYEYLSQMQTLMHHDPQQARQILLDHPSLTKALFQMEIILGMVNNPLGDIAPKGVAPPGILPPKHFEPTYGYAEPPSRYGMTAPPPGVGGTGQAPSYYSAPVQSEHMQYQSQESSFPAPIATHQQPPDPRLASSAVPADPRMQAAPPVRPMISAPRPMVSVAAGGAGATTGAVSPAQQPAPIQMHSASIPAISAEQQALLQQVMSLTPEQIELLPPEQKAQVVALQQQLGVDQRS